MTPSPSCRGLAALAALPFVVVGLSPSAAAAPETAVGASATHEGALFTMTKSSDRATLPSVGDLIRYMVQVERHTDRGVLSVQDAFDPSQLRFVEARIRLTVEQLQQSVADVESVLPYLEADAEVADLFQTFLDEHGTGEWPASVFDELATAVEARQQSYQAQLDAALLAGDDDEISRLYPLLGAWSNAWWTVEIARTDGVSGLVDHVERSRTGREEALAVREESAAALVEAHASPDGVAFVPMMADIGDGTVELSLRGVWGPVALPSNSAVIEYDMVYLGGDVVVNQACVAQQVQPTRPTLPTEEVRMAPAWTPPEVLTDEADVATDGATAASEEERDGCVSLALEPADSTVHVIKEVRTVGADGFVRTPGWGFDLGAGGFEGSGTTTGSGLQWLLPRTSAPRDVTLSEAAAPGALLSDYELVGVACTDAGQPVEATVDPVARSVVVPGVRAGADISCVFSNEQRAGEVSWQKQDSRTRTVIGGAVFELVGPGGTARVEDCVQEGCTGADTDPRAGYFSVDGLAWGEYTLQEVAAPGGYALGSETRTVTIGSGALQVDLEAFLNTAVTTEPTEPGTTSPTPPGSGPQDPTSPASTPTRTPLAETGAGAPIPLAVGGGLLAGLGGWLVARARRRRAV